MGARSTYLKLLTVKDIRCDPIIGGNIWNLFANSLKILEWCFPYALPLSLNRDHRVTEADTKSWNLHQNRFDILQSRLACTDKSYPMVINIYSRNNGWLRCGFISCEKAGEKYLTQNVNVILIFQLTDFCLNELLPDLVEFNIASGLWNLPTRSEMNPEAFWSFGVVFSAMHW